MFALGKKFSTSDSGMSIMVVILLMLAILVAGLYMTKNSVSTIQADKYRTILADIEFFREFYSNGRDCLETQISVSGGTCLLKGRNSALLPYTMLDSTGKQYGEYKFRVVCSSDNTKVYVQIRREVAGKVAHHSLRTKEFMDWKNLFKPKAGFPNPLPVCYW